ncbi:aldose 1-epimerase [Trueperella pecoris]|uniref:Aldose 1-epimerase n=1 Tax=Trueperella pecoris TaxID=2733571 RepID=A0A7M1QTY3_9ACTO|nr:aldose 1-epimerase [Trueperella pecoris]QOQ38683.1 aldose 1-epimerase [Trueperella pecoris]QOR44825.1 aldose 1-epimerase [Trueperella pecoris]QTG74748.1 aldose 1-epimerase [Trueperella pecoris]
MASTDISKVEKFGHAAWEIVSPTGARALVSERGATLLSWQPEPGVELLAAHESREELESGAGARSMILAPWAGPIADGTYTFDGQDITVDEAVRAYSLAYRQDFRVTSAGTTLSMATLIEPSESYPWKCEVAVHYSLDSGADREEHLSITLEAKNLSDTAAPMTVGWHPYVKIPGMSTVSHLSISVPARTKILCDRRGIPLPGESAYAGVNMPMEIEYLGSTSMNDYYRGLVPDNYGVVATRVVGQPSNASIELTQEPGEAAVVHVDTGDKLERDPRKAIALAPMSAVPDSFNRPDAVGSVRVEAGQSRQMTATLTYVK